MNLAVCFTNFGPYHLARLRALADRLRLQGGRLIAYEVAGSERTYPWERRQNLEPFAWTTLFPDRVLEEIAPADCRRAIVEALSQDQPDAVGIVGYARPESMAAVHWARSRKRPSILLSESQAIDRPRSWWKEAIKRRRVRLFDAALVGGPSHRDYLIELGMPSDRIALGYNAVDNAFFADRAYAWRADAEGRLGLPTARYFLSVCRFAPEKNLLRLVEAFARYRAQADPASAWDLVLCGGGPQAADLGEAITRSGCERFIHRPGFLQADMLPRWYAHASAFVLPSLSEPWGLVVNEAASSRLPLLVSSRAGAAGVLVPEPAGLTGAQFDPLEIDDLTAKLLWMADQPEDQRRQMGIAAERLVNTWGPDRFASGAIEAVELARHARSEMRSPQGPHNSSAPSPVRRKRVAQP
jgi:glycosyltransferase involved in cell wall biosynthesis